MGVAFILAGEGPAMLREIGHSLFGS